MSISNNINWYAIKVKYKTEILVSSLLYKKGIISYVPFRLSTKKYNKKIRNTHIPLLPCFLFINISKPQYVDVLSTTFVYDFVRIGRDIIPVKESEILILKKIEGLAQHVETHEKMILPGQEVYVNQGPLYGMTGKMVKQNAKEKLLINIESLPISILVEIDKKLLSLVNKHENIT